MATREHTICGQPTQEELEEGEIIEETSKEELLQYYVINGLKTAEKLLAEEREAYDEVRRMPEELCYLAY